MKYYRISPINGRHIEIDEPQSKIVEKIIKDKEIVICAAVKSDTGVIVRGHRHGDCIYGMMEGRIMKDGKKLNPGRKQEDQGFITSKNRFVTREEGRILQDAAGIPSVAEHGYEGNTLYSEDLY